MTQVRGLEQNQLAFARGADGARIRKLFTVPELYQYTAPLSAVMPPGLTWLLARTRVSMDSDDEVLGGWPSCADGGGEAGMWTQVAQPGVISEGDSVQLT